VSEDVGAASGTPGLPEHPVGHPSPRIMHLAMSRLMRRILVDRARMIKLRFFDGLSVEEIVYRDYRRWPGVLTAGLELRAATIERALVPCFGSVVISAIRARGRRHLDSNVHRLVLHEFCGNAPCTKCRMSRAHCSSWRS
jgi:hypothetical protein